MRLVYPVLVLATVGGAALTAEPSFGKQPDNFLHPQYDRMPIRSIGVMEMRMRRNDRDAMDLMARHVEAGLAPHGYRFFGAGTFAQMIHRGDGDSLYAALGEQWRKKTELESGTVRALGERVAVDAVLAVFLDKYERETIQYDVRGQSKTEIELRMALYATATGELLWSGKVGEIGLGPYNEASPSAIVGVNRVGVAPQARTSTSLDPPTYEEVATQLRKKITERFPPPPSAAPAEADESVDDDAKTD